MESNGFNEKVNMTLDIDEYALIIGNGWSMRGQINTAISYLKEFFDDKLEVANIFISTWKDGNNYISDTSLWIFTENAMIKCFNYKDTMSRGILNFEVHPLDGVMYSKVEYESLQSVAIDVHLSNSTVQFKAVGGNLRYLMTIYRTNILRNI